jgi:hypothetical protein
MRNCYENDPRNTRKTREKNKKNQCNQCNLWKIFFIIRVNSCNSWGENCMAKTLAVIGREDPYPPYVRNTVGEHKGMIREFIIYSFFSVLPYFPITISNHLHIPPSFSLSLSANLQRLKIFRSLFQKKDCQGGIWQILKNQ